ncbi:MAG: EAL domain-containing protein [Gammaproteobacteria bacterium HGW-Gammaproteobacteria-10]|nr:MAG: EAL domain-containing protein [Gammaproteobacteria bacterium HGW-Gammaproteobacteria-3]PKM35571.1 MAG: EAL domain-containing protein [Gammaproteobacteria bacterium HGW-Gammaproteobacteria-10]
MTDFLIGRQQIFDKKLNIYAYEILFRGQGFDLNESTEASMATHQVITDTILELGINRLVESHKAFINFTYWNILEKVPLNLPKDRIVVEVLENVTIDLAVINNLRELSRLGYIIALDDFVLTEEWRPLLEFADIVKIDVLQRNMTETRQLIEQLKPHPVKLLAEKIETQAQFKSLLDLGCEYFQGYFLSKPNIVEGRRIGVNQTAAIRLLGIINKPDVEFSELVQVISQDVSLSFKLLHYINSAFFAIPRKIESIKHAVSYLGLNEIKRWSNILTLASLSHKPKALMQTALVRGKMCEQLALLLHEDPEHYFLIGMLSCIDSILDIPLQYALEQLPLTSDVADAILHRQGIAGEILTYVLNYERWPPPSVTFKTLDSEKINLAYLESIAWVDDIFVNIT